MQVYISTINFRSKPLVQIMCELDRLDYPRVEISSGHPPQADSWDSIARYATHHKASVLLHNYAPPEPGNLLVNLANPDPAGREHVIMFLKSRIDLTKKLGSDYYSFHGGYRVPYRFGVHSYQSSQILDADLALEIFLESLQEVVVHAEAQKVHIGIENHVVASGNEANLILYDQVDFETVFKKVSSDYVHLHLDVGHLKVTCETLALDPYSFVEALRSKIMAVHLHDNDGASDSHLPFGEDAWFLGEIRQLPRLRYVCLETRTNGDRDRIQEMVHMLWKASKTT